MKRMALVLSLLAVTLLVVGGPAVEAANFDAKNVQVVVGLGYSVPVRSESFTSATTGAAFYRSLETNYVFNETVAAGLMYGDADYSLAFGGELQSASWGPVATFTFDLVPENHWYIGIKVGGAKTHVESSDLPAELSAALAMDESHGDMLERGATYEELLAAGINPATPEQRRASELYGIDQQAWDALLGAFVEFYAGGNVKMRLGVDFHDLNGNEVGALFPYVKLAFKPMDLHL